MSEHGRSNVGRGSGANVGRGFSPGDPKDAAARKRIHVELGRSLLVEAGAGSGKTHEMAARMAAGVASGAYEIEHIAAVTFTRKAAAELRGRFQLALEEELARVGREGSSNGGRPFRAGEPADLAAREARLRAALSKLERFFAGTIHAFCARLLRERPVEAGVAPGFTELDETEDAIVRQQAWRDFRAQAKASGDATYLELLDAGIEPRKLEQAFATVCQFEEVTFPPGDGGAPDAAAAWQALETFRNRLQALLPDPLDARCKTQERAERFQESWRFTQRVGRTPARLAQLFGIWASKPDVRQGSWSSRDAALEAKALHDSLRTDVVVPYLDAWHQYLYRLAVTLLVKARTRARDERVRRSVLSFNDLLITTADLLRRDSNVRESLGRKFRWLFVDEFQDTDPIQAEIMFLLAAQPDGAGGLQPAAHAEWRHVPLRPGALFVVGDPKQSIYRFRRADIDIYNDVRARLGGTDDSGIVRLTTNFRSVPELCEWANKVFETRFPPAPTQHAPQFARLDAHRAPVRGHRASWSPGSSDPGEPPALAVLTTQAAVESGDVAAHEAERIAQYIRDQINRGRKPGDFLILTRKRKALRPYARALEALQVPIEVSGAGAFGESDEVRALALLISALADPQDPIPLLGVLRGPLFGLSDPELFAYRQSGGYFSLFSDVGRPFRAGDPDPVVSALEILRRWHCWTRRLPAGAALDRILEDSGYLALAATSADGVEAGDLLHAVDRVRAVLESGLTLADAADALLAWSGLDDEGLEESSEVDSLPLQPGRPEVVRLMNLHKAKGLEASVVFLVDPLGGFESRADVRIVRHPDAAAEGFFQIKTDHKDHWMRKVVAAPADWSTYEAEEQAYLTAEQDRLLYVAATRAKDLLVVGRYEGAPGKRTAAWRALDPFLSGVPELKVPLKADAPKPQKVDLSAKARTTAVAAADAAHAQARKPSWAAVSVTGEAKLRHGQKDLEPDEPVAPVAPAEPDPTRVVSQDTPSHRADAGVDWGTLIHGLLEHAMRHEDPTRDDLRRLALWLTFDKPHLRPVIEQALDTALAMASADFWSAARASAEHHEEAPFAVREEQGGMPTVVSGVIDLVFREDAAWQIKDYKTDADADAAALRQRYAAQLDAYRHAWSRFTKAPVTADIRPAR